MSRKALIAANWKMYKTPAEAKAFVDAFLPLVAGHTRDEIALFPSPVLLPTVIAACKGSNVAVGAQNIHFAEEGAYTGETSIGQLMAVGGTHTLIGHSERRQYFAETDEIVNKKLHTALKHGVVPIVCIGEVLAEREAGKTASVLKTQITGAFAGITPQAAAPIVIAYEPVWAIGTGKTATPEIAVDAHKIIRAEVAKLLGAKRGQRHAHPLRRQRQARQRHRSHRPGRDRRRPGRRRQPQARFLHGHREVLVCISHRSLKFVAPARSCVGQICSGRAVGLHGRMAPCRPARAVAWPPARGLGCSRSLVPSFPRLLFLPVKSLVLSKCLHLSHSGRNKKSRKQCGLFLANLYTFLSGRKRRPAFEWPAQLQPPCTWPAGYRLLATRPLAASFCIDSVPHPFAFFLAKGWEATKAKRTNSCGQ